MGNGFHFVVNSPGSKFCIGWTPIGGGWGGALGGEGVCVGGGCLSSGKRESMFTLGNKVGLCDHNHSQDLRLKDTLL